MRARLKSLRPEREPQKCYSASDRIEPNRSSPIWKLGCEKLGHVGFHLLSSVHCCRRFPRALDVDPSLLVARVGSERRETGAPPEVATPTAWLEERAFEVTGDEALGLHLR